MYVLFIHAIQWIIHVKDTTYKKSLSFFSHKPQFFLPVKLAIIFVTKTCWNLRFLTLSMYKSMKRNKTLKYPKKKKFVTMVLAISVVH